MSTAVEATLPKIDVKYRNYLPDFLFMHLGALLVFYTGVSWASFIAFFIVVNLQGFSMTGAMHRYFSHRAYKTSRWFQFVMGLIATTCGQHDPIYWAMIHRRHHRYEGTGLDPTSRETYGMWWAHLGWLFGEKYPQSTAFDAKSMQDFARFPELRFLNRHYHLVRCVFFGLVYATGAGLAYFYPPLEISPSMLGLQFVVWAGFLSPLWIFHVTMCINSIGHNFGSKRFPTTDNSRNNWLLAFLLLGEGWHNNHHHYPHAERQGFYWWEIDPTHYVLVVLSWLGFVWDLKKVPDRVYAEAEALRRGETTPLAKE